MAGFDHVRVPRCDKPRPDAAQRRLLVGGTGNSGGLGVSRAGRSHCLCLCCLVQGPCMWSVNRSSYESYALNMYFSD